MKQLTIYLSILTFITALILGCGKKFDEEKHKAMLTTQSMFDAEHQTLASSHQKAMETQKAMVAAKKLDAAAEAELAGLLKQEADILTQHEALVKKHADMAASYEKKELDGEKADAQEAEMKSEDAKILENNKAIDAKITEFIAKHDKPTSVPAKPTAKKKK